MCCVITNCRRTNGPHIHRVINHITEWLWGCCTVQCQSHFSTLLSAALWINWRHGQKLQPPPLLFLNKSGVFQFLSLAAYGRGWTPQITFVPFLENWGVRVVLKKFVWTMKYFMIYCCKYERVANILDRLGIWKFLLPIWPFPLQFFCPCSSLIGIFSYCKLCAACCIFGLFLNRRTFRHISPVSFLNKTPATHQFH